MDIHIEKNHVFNIRLAKLISLFQILDPKTIQFRGQNVYYMVIAFVMLCSGVISIILNVSGLNASRYRIFFLRRKRVVHNVQDVDHRVPLGRCTELFVDHALYGFTSSGRWNPHLLEGWRVQSVWFTAVLTGLYFLSLLLYLIIITAFTKGTRPVNRTDGSVAYYRQSYMNLYIIASDETYNSHYVLLRRGICPCHSLLVIPGIRCHSGLCLAICCQVQVLIAARLNPSDINCFTTTLVSTTFRNFLSYL